MRGSLKVKLVSFYGLLLLPVLLWVLVILPNYFSDWSDVSLRIIYAAVSASPLVGGDVSIFGELTPIILAGAIIGLIPKSEDGVNWPAVGLAVLTYFLFLHLSIYFSSGAGVALLNADWPNIAEPQKIILKLISNVRVMAIVVAAAIFGINVKTAS